MLIHALYAGLKTPPMRPFNPLKISPELVFLVPTLQFFYLFMCVDATLSVQQLHGPYFNEHKLNMLSINIRLCSVCTM